MRKSAQARKAEILDAALRLADEVGPDRLSTEAIARAVGLSQPGVFRHFPTKQAIWQAVAATLAERMQANWRRATQEATSPLERLRALFESQLRLIAATPAVPAILFSRELHAENDLLRGQFLSLMHRFHAAVAGEIEAAQAVGTIEPGIVAADAAFLLIGLVQGLAVRWSLAGRTFDLVDEGARLFDLQLSLLTRYPAAASPA
ncbi:MAG: TetR/AcrR family transcriptional regulator [Geminicoccaceae bacterium]|nr:TetR/AcrR family transcriptional regulator [Geminicoccaceae bacterium]